MLAQHSCVKFNSLSSSRCRVRCQPKALFIVILADQAADWQPATAVQHREVARTNNSRPSRCHLQVAAFKLDQARAGGMAEPGSSCQPVRLTSTDLFDAMTTMLGGLQESCLVGYAGQWRTWDLGSNPNSPPALIDDSVNIRLWRITDPGSRTVKQANLYQAPDKMAGPSTRFLPYLTGNAMSGRTDGYGLRVWEFKPDSDIINPDASAWHGNGQVAERSMRVLTVPGMATTIINGALPSSFDEGHQPRFWVLEFIIKEAGSSDRRWSSMNWYELGCLVVNRSINEDVTALPDDLESCFIDPGNFRFLPRRDSLVEDADDYVLTQGRISPTGVATHFAYNKAGQLTVSSGPCCWSSGAAAPMGLAAQQDRGTTADAPAGPPSTAGAAQAPNQAGDGGCAGAAGSGDTQHHGGAADLVYQAYPDMSYCRVPRSLKALLQSGKLPSVVFEAGTVLRDGSLCRWLLEYSTSGDRLIKMATYEHYPAAETA